MENSNKPLDIAPMGAQAARAINEAPIVKCPKCGGIFWDETSLVKSIPGIYTGSKRDQIAPIPVLVCRKCGEVLPQMASIDEFKKMLGTETKEEKQSTIITV